MKYVMFIYLIALFFLSCGKQYSCEKCSDININDTAITASLDTSLTDSIIFFDITLDGKRYFKVSGKNNWSHFWVGSQSGIDSGVSYFMAYRWPFANTSATDSGVANRNRNLLAQYAVGTYPFTIQSSSTSGIILKWKDANGNLWGSDEGAANQTNNSFSILTSTPYVYAPTGSIATIIIYCTFNCTLYDNNGNSIKLKGGRLRYVYGF